MNMCPFCESSAVLHRTWQDKIRMKKDRFSVTHFAMFNVQVSTSVLGWLQHPFVGWVIFEDPEAVWSSHDVQIVQIVAMRGDHRVVAARHHHHVVVFYGASFIDGSVVGVHTLKRKTLRRVESVVVGFFQLGFGRGLFQVVFVRRVA